MDHQPQSQTQHHMSPTILLVMAAVHFGLMFILMYAMVDTWSNVYPNLNQVYMAGIMTSPMVMLEILLMRSMYKGKQILNGIFAVSLAAMVIFFLLLRDQTAISDQEFLRSMIPHHAGALLMCQQASLQDQEIRELCQRIIASQQSEIDLMKEKLAELEENN